MAKPRTAKDRQRNAEIFQAHNRNHEDDIFAGLGAPGATEHRLFAGTNEDSDSSDNEIRLEP